jgi:predicted peptidase
MRLLNALSVIVAFSVLLIAPRGLAANVSDFSVFSLLNSSDQPIQAGRLYVPPESITDPTTLRPLILFFHGSGEAGTDNTAQVNGNIDNLLAAAKSHAAYLYAPQARGDWQSSIVMSNVKTMVDRSIADFSVDPNRIYVTGLSSGGGGVWNFVNQYPDLVAASVPISAVNPSASFSPAIMVNEPIWAFVSRSDTTVPATVTRGVINSLLTVAGQPLPTYSNDNFGPDQHLDFPPLDLHYSDIRGGHGIWPTVYNTPAVYDWMFSHGAVPEPSSLSLLAIGCIGCLAIARRKSASQDRV